MNDTSHHFHDHSRTPVAEVVRDLLPLINAITRRKPPSGDEAHADYRLLASMVALTRQRESLFAAMRLSEATMGHLSVAFVRPACEEYLWLKYLATLERRDANDVLLALGSSDTLRSLSAARAYIGDSTLGTLGFPPSFLSTTPARLEAAENRLAELKERLCWDRKVGPTTGWIAKKVDETDLYNYLYSASSRAVHFSAGEVLRRSWLDASGRVTVEHVDHRVYLSDYALDQLAYLAISTFVVACDWLEDMSSGDSSPREFDAALFESLEAYRNSPRVPLILPMEYELAWKESGLPKTR